jgi:hypothetical protein
MPKVLILKYVKITGCYGISREAGLPGRYWIGAIAPKEKGDLANKISF